MIPSATPLAQPADWRQLYRESAISAADLLHSLALDADALQLAPADAQFPLRAPAPFRARMRIGDAADPLLRQVLPLIDETRRVPGFEFDAVGDLGSRGASGVLHKYHGRVLLIATGSCAIHCRYCFRRHFPYSEELAAKQSWAAALDYLRQHPDVSEVILSGGDPLALSTSKLRELTDGLIALGTIRRLRIHSRLPVVIPQRVDADLLDWLAGLPWPITLVLHSNHAQEIDDQVADVCARLRAAGTHLLNQAVLLRGVNDSIRAQLQLSEALWASGVLPYYLHLLDRTHGSAHFEVGESDARAIYAEMRRQLPGYLVPRLAREIAGEPHKTWL
ncbi:EF-P beta-lysylation protein EpmB [Pseudomarimonas arenosa]|uniref:L-lysine 2,3-aminomutase n=1 Tax=Pseudomarimonas arenosa TaxID=2774145 RepID=A0AAW3ZFX9_9GAMM|nr:EF-P beta-lysylation protein EpmB [Pseudomarimonas arenosa]MBD8524783.1 EF-P beta-lysylation protein EpmB [Pseudomarimonas arenosa]